MAIIKCPECGNMVSDQAATCPHCGVSVKKITNDTIMIMIDPAPSSGPTWVEIKDHLGKILAQGTAGSVFTFKTKTPVAITFNTCFKKYMCPTAVSPENGGKYKATWSHGIIAEWITNCFPVDSINA